MRPVAARGCLVIADISGYTDYVVASPLAHAEDVLADVTATVVDRLERIIHVNKLEGDAAFGYALEGDLDGTMLLDVIDECYFAFRGRLRGIEHSISCDCAACTRLPDLDLKFLVHFGDFILRSGERGEELTGHDVIVAHRLLKNSVGSALGLRGYVLITNAAAEALGVDPAALGMHAHSERYDGVGEVAGFAVDLEERWESERERRRVYVGREEAAFEVEVSLPGSSALVWEYLTAPDKRMLWQADHVAEVPPGGRRGAGTTSFCVDGRASIYEEILDWRPFDYFTERRTVRGSVGVVLTTELEPIDGGVRVVTRIRRSHGRGRLGWLIAGRSFRRGLERRYASLARLMPTRIPPTKRLPIAAA